MCLYVVGFGPGNADGMTKTARDILEKSDIIVGYTTYIDIIKTILPDKTYAATGMRKEKERVSFALQAAASGQTVSLVCSGDSGVYGMAGLVMEMAVDYPEIEIVAVPGVTAALSGAALLGAPLTHDFCVISLSDLLTPWEKIEKRLSGAAMADFVIVLYNPSSKKRADYLKRACDILLCHKSPETVCGYVRNIGRQQETCRILSLDALRDTSVDMFTTVFIGNSQTKLVNGRMVTPRGYHGV